jgi:hypothetical protein
VRRHGKDLRHCYDFNHWLVWTGTHWSCDPAIAEQKAKDTVLSIYEEVGKLAKSDDREVLHRHAVQSEQASRIIAMLALARSEPGVAVRPDEMDRNIWLLNCRNGNIDLRTGQLQPHRREDLITRCRQVEFEAQAELCVQGYGYRCIATRMNEEGIPSMFGSHWNMSNIAQMLRNPVYCGALVYNKRTEGSLFGMSRTGTLRPKKGRRGSFKNASEDWEIVPGVHEPLISQETFDDAQTAMAKRRFAGGKARSTRRTLVSTLLVCKRCKSSFTSVRDTRRKPEFGPPYRHDTCAGYHRYGKAVCGLVRIPGPALDAFVLQAISQVLQVDAKSREQAVEAFVRAMAKQIKAPDTSAVQREIDQLNRRIKTTVTLLADPAFEGIDGLPAVLADLKRKRDSLQGKLDPAEVGAPPPLTPQQQRDWANEQFDKLEQMADKDEVELADRQLVEAFVQRIEIDPDAKTGVVVLHADLQSVLASTRVLGGDVRTTLDGGPVRQQHGIINRINHPRLQDGIGP